MPDAELARGAHTTRSALEPVRGEEHGDDATELRHRTEAPARDTDSMVLSTRARDTGSMHCGRVSEVQRDAAAIAEVNDWKHATGGSACDNGRVHGGLRSHDANDKDHALHAAHNGRGASETPSWQCIKRTSERYGAVARRECRARSPVGTSVSALG